jgi:sulfur relay (sulfurtransferase) DsrF/TusC family protein
MEKNVVLTINHAPFGSNHFVEGLRAAMGLIASTDEFNIFVIFLGEGIYAALTELERNEASKYIATLTDYGFRLSAEKESLVERGLPADDIALDVEVIGRSQVLELLNAADFTIDF